LFSVPGRNAIYDPTVPVGIGGRLLDKPNAPDFVNTMACCVHMTTPGQHVTWIVDDWTLRYSHGAWPVHLHDYADYMYSTVRRMCHVLAAAGMGNGAPTPAPPFTGRSIAYFCRAPINEACTIDFAHSTTVGDGRLIADRMAVMTISVNPLHAQINTEALHTNGIAKVKVSVLRVTDDCAQVVVITDREPAVVFRLNGPAGVDAKLADDDRVSFTKYCAVGMCAVGTHAMVQAYPNTRAAINQLFQWLCYDYNHKPSATGGLCMPVHAVPHATFAERLRRHIAQVKAVMPTCDTFTRTGW
jgi:hypothetical protein